MRNPVRKAVINYRRTERKVSLAGVHRQLINKAHRHTCANPSCRLTFEDSCFTPERNGRCHSCRGLRRPWVERDGRTSTDPRPCCVDNTTVLSEPDDLLRYDCAGPGPWFQCGTCKRTHGHPCTDSDLLNRPHAVTNPEGTT